MNTKLLSRAVGLFLIIFFLTSCTVYTEKRSEALSQAVFATTDSITVGRFELAYDYSKQAERLAYPPKQRIKISPIITKNSAAVSSTHKSVVAQSVTDKKQKVSIPANDISVTTATGEKQSIFRIVIPQHLRQAKILIENSEEWDELMKQKDFAEQLQADNQNLQQVASTIDQELQRQAQANNKMVEDLNRMQRELLSKDLLILRLYIVIVILILTVGGGVYLRIKGIL